MQIHADGAQVRRRRDERGWSQEHLADAAGISLRTIQRIERGEKAARESVMALAAAFGVDVAALTVDVEAEAVATERENRSKDLARLRLSALIHLAGYLFGMMVFGAIGRGMDDSTIMRWATIWWTVAIAGHGLVLVVAELVARHRGLERA
ncbi:helix-turn-helix domain-containing protein [Pseudoxanthomonas sp.]|uniref:helix-turn-helix domain-containing protein n=1 Tax=Pseudoxanthomonas sp. TaxID=1871049 RepID=UPI0025898E7C|nr:helix-turn-helix domain-containing protein [Pseudoxanthomonas sp.]MCR6684769.1 helix-turn-helix domain-containing protein [Pseudoxanthomonas sp.]